MKNLFTTEDAAMLLIDHQVGTVKLAISTPFEEILRDARAFRTAERWPTPVRPRDPDDTRATSSAL
jgi:hypothetical protein